MSNRKESKAMLEVWEWKAECDAEVAHLPAREAVRRLLAESAKSAKRLGLRYAPAKPTSTPVVAEASAKYTAKRKR
jgi:hypothetical protein